MFASRRTGYDSSSESEAEVDTRRRPGLQSSSTPAANSADKKKKKKRLPPQESIDKIWSRFSQPKFSKALNVLPTAPVAPPTSPERANELVCSGYERAAEECRRKVRKIIQECRRVNMRYRDPGFDLDWDLKMEKGHCLNSLGQTKFDISGSSMVNPSATIPKAVKRVHEIFEEPTFMKNVSGTDVKQGSLGDCWLMASLTGLANVEGALQRSCVEYDTRIGIYGFVFYRDGEWIYSIIDDKLYLKSPCWDSPSLQRDLLQQIDREDVERVYRKTYQTGSKALFFAQNKDQNETWVPLIEKAYAKAHGDYACLTGGWIGEGLEDLSGGVTTELLASDILDTESFWENEISRVNEEFLFGCSTGLLDGGYGDRDGISEGHAYNIMEARTLKNGKRLVKLRNPWGKVKKGNWEGAWSDGSKEWTTDVKEELGHTFGSDSVFWISYEDLLRKYQHFDRTRLFRDPDWRCCQRWIGVEVPWKSVYNEKFHIKLTKDSPLVLVLSQLDNRYFRGLQGQYTYRLHFRIHEQGRPEAEDYIVRSHGNYLMDRSVSIELPDMPAGNYSVFISVAGERDSNMLSVEDVVKRECKKRTENEKLSQVGYAYGLAHSKAAAHLEELAKIRKKTEQEKASEARKTDRRKVWAKRHLLKDIQKRQQVKNTDKQKKRRAVRDEERKKKEAASPEERKIKEAAEAEEKKKQEAAEAEVEKMIEELKPKDKAVQTETVKTQGEDKSVQAEMSAADQEKAEIASVSSSGTSTPQDTPLDTPRSEVPPTPAVEDKAEEKVAVPPVDASAEVSGGPPPATVNEPTPAPKPSPAPAPATKAKKETRQPEPHYSDDDSSDSPVEDWEAYYSSDDLSHKSRPAGAPAPPAPPKEEDSEDENEPAPWNAICIVGFRVYSKDEDLELRVVMEGGGLTEGGMGEKGAQDLDNAQDNAGGAREKKEEKKAEEEKKSERPAAEDSKTEKEGTPEKKEVEGSKGDEETKEAGETTETKDSKKGEDGLAPYSTIVRKDDEEFEKACAPVDAAAAEKAEAEKPSADKAATPGTEGEKKQDGTEPSENAGDAAQQNGDPAGTETRADDATVMEDTTMNWG